MALFNEIQVGRYNRLVQKLLGIKGGPPMPTLASDLQMVWLVNNYQAEYNYLQSIDVFSVATSIGAQGAGNTAGVRIRNPIGSNVVGVVTLWNWVLFSGAAIVDNPNVYLNQAATADLASIIASASVINLDKRGRPGSTLIVSQGTDNAPGGAVIRTNAVNATATATGSVDLFPFGMEVPLVPGASLEAKSNVANQANGWSITWRERFLEDSERS